MSQLTGTHVWWAALRHGGMLISPDKLTEHFPDSIPALGYRQREALRRDVTRVEGGADASTVTGLLDTVLETVLELGDAGDGSHGRWLKGSALSTEWSQTSITGEVIRPRRVWLGENGAELPVFVDDVSRLGVGRGRRATARVVEWLRKTGRKVAVLTNAEQWRLIHAGLDYEAHAEWDISLWFEAGAPGPQVDAIRILLSRDALTPAKEGQRSRLLNAIEDSRKGQAELSSMLGERVRRAVELLIRAHGPALTDLASSVTPRDIYLAANRVVMRLVVGLFAEARDLLPRDNALYHGSYGLQGLREELDRFGSGAGAERLKHRYGAWPRLLGLFRVIHEGSVHEALPVPKYGGALFEAGDPDSAAGVCRALAVFEDPERAPSDATVRQLLDLLGKTRVRIRQGTTATWIEAPVDFSDLSSEYIGILYEGLLDYELRRVADNDPVLFLALGDEPALPLSRLESMDDKSIAALVEAIGKKSRGSADADGDDDEEADEGVDETDEGETAELEVDVAEDDPVGDDNDDQRALARARAREWTLRVVEVGKMVAKPRGRNAEAQARYEADRLQKADQLVRQVVLPGEWYLVRYGGTRKGSGSFYTRPQLAIPTIHRTLRPLAYDPPLAEDGTPNLNAPASEWRPKKPETILRLKVCDSAGGSGSFPVGATRFLTEALYEALFAHGRIQSHGDRTLVKLANGGSGGDSLADDLLPCSPDAEEFEALLKARLKRYVVERCIYAVDLDPLAVELCRLALWIETMDRRLPFSFLDHKVKRGNSLVGCWFDRFRDYPVMAWDREGGDAKHSRGAHHEQKTWTDAIKEMRGGLVKDTLREWIEVRERPTFFDDAPETDPEQIHDEAVQVLEEMHRLPIHDTEERAAYYETFVRNNPALTRLKQAFDTWCAIWFWPADELEHAPLPNTMHDLSAEAEAIVRRIADEQRFFHWELEFPDVFAVAGGGFDAMVGNPPWDIQKPNSKEYFSNIDPLYRGYGKQEALRAQELIFQASADEEARWVRYNAFFNALSNYRKYAADPFGDPEIEGPNFPIARGKANKELHEAWRGRRRGRRGYADREHPYRHQGSGDVNLYKMFLELGYAILKRDGRLGLIVPAGIYSDRGTSALRKLFLDRCDWQWLFGFENREKVFDIDTRFKFCAIVFQKGGSTTSVRAAFMRRNLSDWEAPSRFVTDLAAAQIARFSPLNRVVLEIGDDEALAVLQRLHSTAVLVSDQTDDGWKLKYASEFHMTSASRLFIARPKAEESGFRPDEYGRWLSGDWKSLEQAGINLGGDRPSGLVLSRDGSACISEEDIEEVALPLYEGRMIGQFDFSEKGWVSGKGRSAVWREIGWNEKVIEPQFLMLRGYYHGRAGDLYGTDGGEAKLAFMDVTSATNARTAIASVVGPMPCGNSAPVLLTDRPIWILAALMNSFAYDFVARMRCGGLHLNYFVIEETPLVPPARIPAELVLAAARLAIPAASFAPEWLRIRAGSDSSHVARTPWRELWALTLHERLRLRCIVDACIAALYGLDSEQLSRILRDCDHPKRVLQDNEFTRGLDPKGFWRLGSNLDPELRHTVLTLVAYEEIKESIERHSGDRVPAVAEFLSLNGGEGWAIPATVRLADYGLGHDDRANVPQPVASRLGERFLPWQLEQDADESWRECEVHARNLLGAAGYADLLDAIANGGRMPVQDVTPTTSKSGRPDPSGTLAELTLFDS